MSTWGPTECTEDSREAANNSGTTNNDTAQNRVGSNTSSGSRVSALSIWTNVTVPQGATIDSASVAFIVDSGTNVNANFDVHAEDIDDCPLLAVLDDVYEFRVPRVTTASVPVVQDAIAASGETHTVTGLAAVIQEIVDRPGWVTGNALGLIFRGRSDVNKVLYFAGQADTTYSGPLLTINYTEGGGGGGPSVALIAESEGY